MQCLAMDKRLCPEYKYGGINRTCTLIITVVISLLTNQFIIPTTLGTLFEKLGVLDWDQTVDRDELIKYWFGQGNNYMLFIIAAFVTLPGLITIKIHAFLLVAANVLSCALMFHTRSTTLVSMGIFIGPLSCGFGIISCYAILELFYDYGKLMNGVISASGDMSYGTSSVLLSLVAMQVKRQADPMVYVYLYEAMLIVVGTTFFIFTPSKWTPYATALKVKKGELTIAEYDKAVNEANMKRSKAICGYVPERDPPFYGYNFRKVLMTKQSWFFIIYWVSHFIRAKKLMQELHVSFIKDVIPEASRETAYQWWARCPPIAGAVISISMGFLAQTLGPINAIAIANTIITIGCILINIGTTFTITAAAVPFAVALSICFSFVSLWFPENFGYANLQKFQGFLFALSGVIVISLDMIAGLLASINPFENTHKFMIVPTIISVLAYIPIFCLWYWPAPPAPSAAITALEGGEEPMKYGSQ